MLSSVGLPSAGLPSVGLSSTGLDCSIHGESSSLSTSPGDGFSSLFWSWKRGSNCNDAMTIHMAYTKCFFDWPNIGSGIEGWDVGVMDDISLAVTKKPDITPFSVRLGRGETGVYKTVLVC